MSFATANGIVISKASVIIPDSGIWHARIDTVTSVYISGSVTLVLGDLTLKGFVRQGGVSNGYGSYMLAGGSGGWRKPIEAKPYRNDLGVKLSYVLEDAARECGETITVPADIERVIGIAWLRPAALASATVRALLGAAWYVDGSGATIAGRRPAGEAKGYSVLRSALSSGRVTLATETPAGVLPGTTIEVAGAAMQIRDISYSLDKNKLRAEVSV